MARYHNNKLTEVGLDSDSDEDKYTLATPNAPSKRKRSAKPTMGNCWTSQRDSGTSNGYAANDQGPVSNDGAIGLSSELPPTGYSYGGEQFVPYHNGSALLNASHSQNSYGGDGDDGGGDYGQMFTPPMSAYLPPPGSDMYTFPAYAYEVPVDVQDAVQTEDHVRNLDGAVRIKTESEGDIVSYSPAVGSEEDESDYDSRRVSKAPKLNKDGVPRKPRQPRAKLLKWDDNDWKNVALGLVWACGENGLQIPFDQASQVVSETCTAGALQQALLKLRGKQVDEGYQIPHLKMAWTRKNKKSSSVMSSANERKNLEDALKMSKLPRKKPTRFVGQQSCIVTLKRAYKDTDRHHLAHPYRPRPGRLGQNRLSLSRSSPSASIDFPRAQNYATVDTPFSMTPTRSGSFVRYGPNDNVDYMGFDNSYEHGFFGLQDFEY